MGEGATRVERITVPGDWYEPYRISLGYRVGDLLFLSGQAAISRQGEIVGVGDFDAQAQQTFENLRFVLESAGSGLEHIVKVTIYLTSMRNFPKIVDLRERWFTPPIRRTRSSRCARSLSPSSRSRSMPSPSSRVTRTRRTGAVLPNDPDHRCSRRAALPPRIFSWAEASRRGAHCTRRISRRGSR